MMDILIIRVEFFVDDLGFDVKNDQETGGNCKRETSDVNQREITMLSKVSPGDEDVIFST